MEECRHTDFKGKAVESKIQRETKTERETKAERDIRDTERETSRYIEIVVINLDL